MVVIAGACRVSRFKSSFYLLPDRPGLNPIFVFIRARFPGDRSTLLSLSLPLLSRSCAAREILRNWSIRSRQFLFFLSSTSFATYDQQRCIFAERIVDAQKRTMFGILFPLKRGNWRGEGNISESAIRSPGVRRNEVNAYVTLSLRDDRKTEADP